MKAYDHNKIEKRVQSIWNKKKAYKIENVSKKKKYYVLDMFPYPSGAGLHVGHPKGYIGSDVFARYKIMQGFNVLHPMGYDAFGLPAEQYAIEHNINPRQAVEKNVKTFEAQLSKIGLSYDWDRKVNTTDPEFYKWTQWIFLKIYNSWYNKDTDKAEPIEKLIRIFEKSGNEKVNAVCGHVDLSAQAGIFSAKEWKIKSKKEKQDILMKYRLAYEGYAQVNWCPKLGTVLANDEIVEGKDGPVSERGGHPVEKKNMRQWFMRITAYGDRLLAGLEGLDWSSHIKEIQKNWIGEKIGINITYKIKDIDKNVTCFTTRPDTNFGATFIVIGPEHDLIKNQETLGLSMDVWKKVEEYKKNVIQKSTEDRINNDRKKTGVFLNLFCINPLNNFEMALYVSDYVLGNVGTGAVIGVPGHDVRDFEFAQAFNLPIVRVVQKNENDILDITTVEQVQEHEGFMVNSGFLNGLDIHEATNVIMDYIEKEGYGKKVTNYKMRDAIFARQRYWGEPIPLKYDKNGMISPLPENKLPLKLPPVKSYQPTGSGESPLAGVKDWVKNGYETNTMPGWAGSSWYFLRYMDPKNKKAFADKKNIKYWKNVDMYVGGQEHATGHLLYSRFWHKVLKDYGLVVTEEPFQTLRNQGMILGADNRKMSKRWGNVINPDDVIKIHGADTLRVYEMFMGPFNASLPWSTDNIVGSRRFLERVWKLGQKILDKNFKKSGSPVLGLRGRIFKNSYLEFSDVDTLLHKTIKKVTEDIENFDFNTCISSLMILLNEMSKSEDDADTEDSSLNVENCINKKDFEIFLKILNPFAPHITEEIWSLLGNKTLLVKEKWPVFDKHKIKDATSKIVIQINGKLRAEIFIDQDENEESVKGKVLQNEIVLKYMEGKEIKRFIYVKNKLVNIVV